MDTRAKHAHAGQLKCIHTFSKNYFLGPSFENRGRGEERSPKKICPRIIANSDTRMATLVSK